MPYDIDPCLSIDLPALAWCIPLTDLLISSDTMISSMREARAIESSDESTSKEWPCECESSMLHGIVELSEGTRTEADNPYVSLDSLPLAGKEGSNLQMPLA